MKQGVILVSGKIYSGKNTLADMLRQELEAKGLKVHMDSFAKALKDMCKEAFRPLTEYLNTAVNRMSDMIWDENWYEKKNPITRLILQAVGTEIVRTVNPNYWSEQFIKRCKESNADIIINSDCRFPSEIRSVQEAFAEVLLIRVNRTMERNGKQNEHESETALDDFQGWDYRIQNDETLEELARIAKMIVRKFDVG